MLPTLALLRKSLLLIVDNKSRQGHVVDGLRAEIEQLPESYDAMAAMAQRLASLPLRADWTYVEPDGLPEIWAECAPTRPLTPMAAVDPVAIAPRVECAFLSSVCGCILGKPVEVNPTLDELRKAAEATGEWPLRDYLTEKLLVALGRRHGDWVGTVRERIVAVEPDDDLSYTILGMVLLERHGVDFTRSHVADLWLNNLAPLWTWGPERTTLIKAALRSIGGGPTDPYEEWAMVLNPNDEACGALIRADAYGYACPGHPALAAELAWRDAGFTHRRTGIYGTMFAAAAISAAFVARDPLEIFEVALQFVPRRSRFFHVAADSLAEIRQASDWLDGYRRVHEKYREFDHCQIYQEIGTVMNTLRFASDIGDGIGKQVSQGNDTDSFGCTCGSILGAYFGPEKLDARWLAPFHNTIHTSLAAFHESSLSEVARRMGQLPQRMCGGQA